MTGGLHTLIAREAGSGGGRGRRTRGPRRRPPYTAHPAEWWEPDTTAAHLGACRTGRDGNGAWKPWDELTTAEQWARFWEHSVVECGVVIGAGPVNSVEVP